MSQINLRCPSGSSVYRNNSGEGWFRLLLSGVIIYLSKVEKKEARIQMYRHSFSLNQTSDTYRRVRVLCGAHHSVLLTRKS